MAALLCTPVALAGPQLQARRSAMRAQAAARPAPLQVANAAGLERQRSQLLARKRTVSTRAGRSALPLQVANIAGLVRPRPLARPRWFFRMHGCVLRPRWGPAVLEASPRAPSGPQRGNSIPG